MGLQRNEFMARLHASMEEGSFVKISLGHARDEASALRKLLIRPVVIRGEKLFSVVSRFATRDQTANLPVDQTLELIEQKLGTEFLTGHLFTQTEELQLQFGVGEKKDRLRILAAQHAPALLGHDLAKSRKVDPKAKYLAALGVTDAAGKIRMGDKFRQIERFVDLLASAYRESGLASQGQKERGLTLSDMGSGKGYLTFAAYDFFDRTEGVLPTVTGVEARPELVRVCNQVAGECGFSRLKFLQSSIADYTLSELDILVALHACDTATDDALAAGIKAGASIMLVAPCCQKEIRPQVDRAASQSPLRDLLRFGIFAERHAEMATDALRALLLERAGYKVRVCEFVAPEHTAKNIMIIATRRFQPLGPESIAELEERIEHLKSFYGIQHHRLQQLFLEGRQLGGSPQAQEQIS